MPDRTSQPATMVGVNPIYTNARFLWNAAVPDKNSLNNASSNSGLKGTDNTGTAGKYRVFGVDGQMDWNVTLPTGPYTVVIVHAFPTANISAATTLTFGTSGGLRFEPYTSGGGVYEDLVHTAVGASANRQVTSVASFNTAPWVEVVAFTGSSGSPANQLRRYRKSGLGVNTSGTETLTYVSPSGGKLYLGSGVNTQTQGVYAVLVVEGDLGDTECQALRDNPWRMFAPVDTTPPVLTSPTGTATGANTATVGATTDEGNGTLYAVVTTSATAPSVSQIVSGQNHLGAAAAWSGNVVVSSTGAKTLNATGLSGSTSYYAHLVQRDASSNDSNVVSSSVFTTSAPTDTTPPVLTSPTGVATGTSTANGTVSTNEGNGTLYAYVSTNSSETATTVKTNGSTQAVSSTGVKNFSFTGLTASTSYYVHYLHRDAAANDSNVVSSAVFTTNAPATATITLSQMKNNTGTILSSLTGVTAYVYSVVNGSLVVTKTGLTTNSTGICTFSDAAIAAGTTYRVVVVLATGAEGMEKVTAT